MFAFQFIIRASEDPASADERHEEKKEFSPGSFIIDHVVDAHEWHILDYKNTHVSIPLPIILVHEGELSMFMSSKFHHGHSEYKGFNLELEGENKGKIVHVASGELPLDLSITKNIFAMLFSMVLIAFIFISIGKSYGRRKGQAPKGLQSLLEPLILFIRDDVAKASIGEKRYEKPK